MTIEYTTQEEINRRLLERQDRLEKAIRRIATTQKTGLWRDTSAFIDNILAGKE